MFLEKNNLVEFADALSGEYDIFFPKLNGRGWEWKKREKGQAFSLEGHRAALPAKYFFYSTAETLKEKKRKPSIVFGMRGCDVRGLELLKKIYLEEPADPYFRRDVLIFSSDCTSTHKNCFCDILGDKPWAEKNFDLNFTPISGGYLVESNSEEGNSILEKHKKFFRPETKDEKTEKSATREKTENDLKDKNGNASVNLAEVAEKIKTQNPVFEKYAAKCVSCSACTTICPACFCFFLSEGDAHKTRFADSCQFVGYARVAGGANPRKNASPRFKHRFECKFVFRRERQGLKGCVGCGRCVDACQGKIDFREVVIESANS